MARDHFLPKTYLRHFTAGYLEGISDGRIEAYSVSFERHRSVSINKHVGFEHDLYAGHPLDKAWQTNEQRWPSVVEALRSADLRDEIISDLLTFTAIQFCRVPSSMEAVARQVAFSNRRVVQTELNGESVNAMMLDMVYTRQVLDQIERVLPSTISIAKTNYHWDIFCNQTDELFLTNDQPCMWDRESGGVVFPISLELALVGTYTETPRQEASVKVKKAKPNIIRKINRETIRKANRLIFAPYITSDLLRFFRKAKKEKNLDPMNGGRSFSNSS